MKRVKLSVTGKIRSGSVAMSSRVMEVAGMFGVAISQDQKETLFENVQLEIAGGNVILITGPSGAGKSTLLREIARSLENAGPKLMRLGDIELEKDRAVVDCFPCSLEETLGHLSRAGLSEAHVLLRAPKELSEGQGFRYRLARFFASEAHVLVADEFCATLDRVTARVVAFGLSKFVRASGKAAVLATTHEDLAQDLQPSLKIYKCLGPGVELHHK